MKNNNLIFIDLETTGLDPDKHEIIEIGAILARQTSRANKMPEVSFIEEIEIKIKPESIETADPEALRINGYNESEWLFATDLKQALESIIKKSDKAVLVGQNVSFDINFLERAFRKTSLKNPFYFHSLDLVSIAYAKLSGKEGINKFTLWSLSEYFNIKNEKAHTAMADIRATFEIYKKLIELP